MNRVLTRLIILTILVPNVVLAEDTRGWLIRAYGGYSLLDDQDADSRGIGSAAAGGDVKIDGGYTAGLGLGYRYSRHLILELAWEYRSHDSEVALDNGQRFDDGDYASNTFWLNGHYRFAATGRWQPYIGAGVGYIEEIDIDLDRRGERERSFSDDGDVAWQVFAGLDYELNAAWILQAEVRYGFLDDVTLDEESGSARLSGLDYDPVTFQLGVVYRF